MNLCTWLSKALSAPLLPALLAPPTPHTPTHLTLK